MENKFIIFLVFTIVAGRFLVLGSTNSCIPATSIGADLAVIQFAVDVAYVGLGRTAVIIFTEIRAVLADFALGYHTNNKSNDSSFRAAVAENETVTAFMVGINPTLEVLKIIEFDLDVQAAQASLLPLMQTLVGYIYRGIKLAQGKHSNKNLAEIKDLDAKLQAGATTLIGNFFTAIHISSLEIPPETEALVTCVENIVTAQIVDAFKYLFDGIYILWNALSKGNKTKSEDTFRALAAAQNKGSSLLRDELKFTLLRNLRIGEFLNTTGIVAGLFAIQSASGGSCEYV